MSTKEPQKTHLYSIVVLGRLYTTLLDLTRSLGKANYKVYPVIQTAYDTHYKIIRSSKYAVKTCRISRASNKQALAELLRFSESIPQPAMLLPTDDASVEFMDTYSDELCLVFKLPLYPGVKKGYLSELMDKHFQRSLAQRAGLTVPNEWVVNVQAGGINPEITYPCFCKPAVSAEGSKKEQKRCDSPVMLSEHLTQLSKSTKEQSVVVQEYMNISEEYIILGACTINEARIVGVVRKIVRTKYTPGLGVIGILEPIESVESLNKIKDKITNLLRDSKHIGLFDLEFFKADGDVYFNELNLRASGLGYSMNKAGINTPLFFVDSFLGNEPDHGFMDHARYGRTFLKEKNAFEDYRYDKISLLTLLKYYAVTKDKLMSDKSDVKPNQIFYMHQLSRIMKKCAKKPMKLLKRK